MGCRRAKASSSPAASGWSRVSRPSAAWGMRDSSSRACLKLRNDLGLLAEQYDPKAKRQVGNFPQAFSHIALVNAAFDLDDGIHLRRRFHRHPKART